MLLAGGVAVLVFLLANAFCHITFLNNDDVSIQRAISGWQTGVPYPAHPFANPLLSAPVSLLYRLFPAIAWWGRLQQAAMLLSITVTGCCLLLAADGAGIRPAHALGGFALLCLGVFSSAIVQIAFTLTAALAGTAAVSLILTEDPARPCAWPRRISALLLLLACFLFRNSSGICVLPFFLFACAYRVVLPACGAGLVRRARMRNAACLLLGVAISALAIAANAHGRVHFNDPGYEEFDAARSAFADYPHPSYAEDPALYASVGWDETLYDLASSWCFLDERIDADALNAIAAAGVQPRSVAQKLSDALQNGIALARGNGRMQWVLAFPAAAFIWMLLGLSKRRESLLPALAAGCFALGAFLLCGYLCYTGRFLLRTFFLIAYPATAAILLTALEVRRLPPRLRMPKWAGALAATLLLAPSLAGSVLTCRALVLYDPGPTLARVDDMYAYALANPDNIYIRDTYTINDIDAFRTFPERQPTNVIEWGGNGMYTGALSRQVALNGLAAFNGETLLGENVYLITTRGSAQEAFLLRYARDRLRAETIELVAEFGDRLAVYRFRRDG